MRSFRDRLLIVVTLLGAVLQATAGLAAGRPASQVSVNGELQLYTGGLPAVWSYDASQDRMLIDVQVQENLRSWVLLDWKTAKPMGFVGREDGCFSFPLQGQRPSPASFDRLLRALSPEAAQKAPGELPEGLNSVRKGEAGDRYLVLKEPDAILVFKIGSAASVKHLPDFSKDTSRCQPLSVLTGTLTNARASQPSSIDKADSASSLLQYNHPYTFRGAIYGHLSYKGEVFSQTKAEYDTAFKACENAGSGKCKPYYESGGWFGRYGYHCGDGWGSGTVKVSGQDYCCYLHDNEVWGGSGKQAENLCGFAACMTCKYYTSLPDWEQNFKGDFWAQKAIAAYVAAGIAVTLCHPQNYLTGFTCN